jgi:hypothetical protein
MQKLWFIVLLIEIAIFMLGGKPNWAEVFIPTIYCFAYEVCCSIDWDEEDYDDKEDEK